MLIAILSRKITWMIVLLIIKLDRDILYNLSNSNSSFRLEVRRKRNQLYIEILNLISVIVRRRTIWAYRAWMWRMTMLNSIISRLRTIIKDSKVVRKKEELVELELHRNWMYLIHLNRRIKRIVKRSRDLLHRNRKNRSRRLILLLKIRRKLINKLLRESNSRIINWIKMLILIRMRRRLINRMNCRNCFRFRESLVSRKIGKARITWKCRKVLMRKTKAIVKHRLRHNIRFRTIKMLKWRISISSNTEISSLNRTRIRLAEN